MTRTHGIQGIVLGLMLIGVSWPTHAESPRIMSYQGRLLNGTNLVNASVAMRLRIYDAPVGGTLLYEDTDTVTVVDGLYSTFMGDDTTTGDLEGALSSTNAHLEIVVNGVPLSPRERIAGAAYAVYAWGLSGNAGTSPGIHFLGTTDDQPLEFRVQNERVFRIQPASNAIFGASASMVGGSVSNWIGADSPASVIAGGGLPSAPNTIATNVLAAAIGGGLGNTAAARYVTIAGGALNEASADGATIGGGGYRAATLLGNYVSAQAATVAGGAANVIEPDAGDSAIGGGYACLIQTGSVDCVVGGGYVNYIGPYSEAATIGGGYENTVGSSATYATVPGGIHNEANAASSFAAGMQAKAMTAGTFVWADGQGVDFASTAPNQFLIRAAGGVGIGTNVTPEMLTVAGNALVTGSVTAAKFSGDGSMLVYLSGGQLAGGSVSNSTLANDAVDSDKVVNNSLSGVDIADGTLTGADIQDGSISRNDVESNSFWNINGNSGILPGFSILGTLDNLPLDIRVNNQRGLRIQPSTSEPILIGGASGNTVSNDAYGAVIGGGNSQRIEANAFRSAIGGGQNNLIEAYASLATIGGGNGNRIQLSSTAATIGGGDSNTIVTNANYATVAGGTFNVASGSGSVVGGGGTDNSGNYPGNRAGGHASTVSGGFSNTANGLYATVPGGKGNIAAGNYSFAAGRRAQALNDGAFVWADSADAGFASSANNQFLIRAAGGVGINTNQPIKTLHVAGDIQVGRPAVWASPSDNHFINFGDTDYVHIGEVGGDDLMELRAGRFYFQSGFVGIGTDSPQALLHVANGSSSAPVNPSAIAAFESSGHSYLQISSSNVNERGILFGDPGSSADGGIVYIGLTDRMEFRVNNNATRMTILSNGFVGINTTSPTNLLQVSSGGAWCNGVLWQSVCDRNRKEDFKPVDRQGLLQKVAALPITEWIYKQDEGRVRHIGPTAQDFHAAFGVGDNDTSISSVDPAGVALAAIQGMYALVQEQRAEIEALKAEVAALSPRRGPAGDRSGIFPRETLGSTQ